MPRYGFNFLWFFGKDDRRATRAPDLGQLDLLREMGLDFVRIPCDYRIWTAGTRYAELDPDGLARIDAVLEACRARGLHMNLNLHRAPGYCINGRDLETHNLWTDPAAQDGFVAQWEHFARRYRSLDNEAISFDLVNEPSGDEAEREGHEQVIRRTVAAIRSIDPDREIVIDGWGGGHQPLPELADLDVIQSGRGYQPFSLTHYRAPWAAKIGTMEIPPPVYPGVDPAGKHWDRDALAAFYQPWRDLEARGVRIHIGEFGCYSETPNDVALRWFADLLDVFRSFGWGYSLWEFAGAFGIVDHGRPGTEYEDWNGYRVDRQLLDLYLAGRV